MKIGYFADGPWAHKTLEKIQLTEPLQRSDIILDKTILRFYKEFLKFL